MPSHNLSLLLKRKLSFFFVRLSILGLFIASVFYIPSFNIAYAGSSSYDSSIGCQVYGISYLSWSGYPSTYAKVVGNLWSSATGSSWYIEKGGQSDYTGGSGNLSINNAVSRIYYYRQEIGDHYASFLTGGHVSTYSSTIYC